MKVELRDDIQRDDILKFLALIVGLFLYTYIIFYSGWVLT